MTFPLVFNNNIFYNFLFNIVIENIIFDKEKKIIKKEE